MSKYQKLLSASVLVMGLGLVVNLVGLSKELLVAYHFGIGDILDIYSIGLALPVLFSGFIGSSIGAAVIPAFMIARERGEEIKFLHEVSIMILGCVFFLIMI